MGVNFLSVSAVCTILSLVGVQYWGKFSLEKHQPDVLIVNDLINSENATRAIEHLFSSYTTLLLVSSLAFNVIILVILGLKVSFFLQCKHNILKFTSISSLCGHLSLCYDYIVQVHL